MAQSRGPDVAKLSPQETKTFLEENNINPKISNLLFKKVYFDGNMLMTFTKEDYEALGIKQLNKAAIILLCKLRDKNTFQSFEDFTALFAAGKESTPDVILNLPQLAEQLPEDTNSSNKEIAATSDEKKSDITVQHMDSVALGALLRKHKLPNEAVNKLIKAGFNGQMLNDWTDTQLERFVKRKIIKEATLLSLLDIRDSLQKGTDTRQAQFMSNKNPTEQKSRNFFSPVETGFCYKAGCYLKNECGSTNILEPAREFKQFDITGLTDVEIETALVKRAGKFIIGCMNLRSNGTIYFGVLDNQKIGEEYKHGKISGVRIPFKAREKFQNMMDNNFTKQNAKQFMGHDEKERKEMTGIMRLCINCIQFVPIEGSKDMVVMEIDVKPSSTNVSSSIVFSLRPNAKKAKQIFIRDGTETKLVKKTTEIAQLEKDILRNMAHRRDQESYLYSGNASLKERLRQHICRGYQKLNEGFHYCLITDSSSDDIKAFSWLSKINWAVIYDFNSKTRESGLYKTISTHIATKYLLSGALGKMFKEPKSYDETDFDSLRRSTQCLYINCNEADADFPTWLKDSKKGIAESFCTLVHTKFVEVERLVVVILLGSEGSLKKLALTMTEFFLYVKMNQMVCLFNQEVLGTLIANELRDVFNPISWKNQMIHVTSWSHLKDFVEEVASKENCSYEIRVPSSSGVKVVLSQEYLKYLKTAGIEVLGSNHCENLLKLPSEALKELCTVEVQKFLKGGKPEWNVFYICDSHNMPYPVNCLVERDLVEVMVENLESYITKDACVVMKRLTHFPGAGATTIGRNVLWKLRKKMRCIVIDGEDFTDGDSLDTRTITELADNILDFRNKEEDECVWKGSNPEATCKPVLILLDNANYTFAKALEMKLHGHVWKNMWFKKTMFILLYLYRSFDMNLPEVTATELKSDSKVERGSQDNHSVQYFLPQKLSKEEQIKFKGKLEQFINAEEIKDSLPDMLSFVIMATNNEDDSAYVKSIVDKSLRKSDDFPLQQRLLLWLSILKYFGDLKLPSSVCRRLVVSQVLSDASRIKDETKNGLFDYLAHPGEFLTRILRPQVQIFLAEEKEGELGLYDYLSITHFPVACQLYEALIKDKHLSEVVKNIIADVSANIKEMPTVIQEEVNVILRKLLVRRTSGSDPVLRKGRFSKLIEKIEGTESFDETKDLLTFGFDSLLKENQAYVAQALARIHIEHLLFEGAIHWAGKAIEIMPHSFAMHDTMGQVYKRRLRFLIRSEDFVAIGDCMDIIRTAAKAEKHFEVARDTYLESKKGQRDFHIIDLALDNEDAPTNEPGLMGWVESNVNLVEYLLERTNELKEAEMKEMFLKRLRNEEGGIEFTELFYNVAKTSEWEEFVPYFRGVFKNTRKCLETTIRKLTYFNHNENDQFKKIGLKMLEDNITKFEKIFGCKDLNVEDTLQRNVNNPKLQLQEVRRSLITSISNCFGWLIQNVRHHSGLTQSKMPILLAAIRAMDQICQNSNCHFNVQDKLSYINVAFSHAYLMMNPRLSWEKADQYCQDLIIANVDYPEPYFFYIVMHWPTNGILNDQEIEFLPKCQSKLKALEETYPDFISKLGTNVAKPRVLFYLRQGKQFERLTSGKILYSKEPILELQGNLDEKRHVEIPIKGSDVPLKLRSAYLSTRGRELIHYVRFRVGFTFGGPVAYGVKEDVLGAQGQMRAKIGN